MIGFAAVFDAQDDAGRYGNASEALRCARNDAVILVQLNLTGSST
ncbi:MAG: hypothetical protein P4L66_12575 [Acetobacteraceae bacterium]|nr:hypothetical protein [Acetobacteraceae bacterium]